LEWVQTRLPALRYPVGSKNWNASLGFAVHRYTNIILSFISSTYEKLLKGTPQNACIYVDGIKARQQTTFCLCLGRISLLIAQKCILQIKHVHDLAGYCLRRRQRNRHDLAGYCWRKERQRKTG